MSKLIDLSDEAFASLAYEAFLLGLQHGRVKSFPMTVNKLMQCLPIALQEEWRIIDKNKLRQVYGAGFDIRKIERLMKDKK